MPQAIAIPLAFAAGSALLGGSAIQAAQQARTQKNAVRAQEEAQRLATSRAAAEQRRIEREQRRLNQRRPDVAGLLASEQRAALAGTGATSLTGAAGIATDRLTLARPSLLGAV